MEVRFFFLDTSMVATDQNSCFVYKDVILSSPNKDSGQQLQPDSVSEGASWDSIFFIYEF